MKRNIEISGSIIGTILGLNEYKTAGELFNELYYDIIGETNEAMERGIIAERYLIDFVKEQIGEAIEVNGHKFVDKDYEFFTGTPDALGIDKVIEIKTSNQIKYDLNHFAQVQWYMMLTGYKKALICVFKLPSIPPLQFGKIIKKVDIKDLIIEWKFYEVEKDEEFIRVARERALKFYEDLQSGRIESGYDLDPVMKYRIAVKDSYIEADNRIMDLILKYEDITKKISELEKEKDQIKKQIQEEMKEKEYLVSNGIIRVRWSNEVKEVVDASKLREEYPLVYEAVKKETVTRVFRIMKKEIKGAV